MAEDSCVNSSECLVEVHPLSSNPDECWKSLKSSKVVKAVDPKDFISSKPENHLRFVCISDTHTKTDNLILPPGDVLLHAGDFTQSGDIEEVVEFNEFLGKYRDHFQHIIVIAGNHEVKFDSSRPGNPQSSIEAYFSQHMSTSAVPKSCAEILSNCIYLEDSRIIIHGIKIYGSPWQPAHFNLGFNLARGQPLLDKWNLIPEDTDILITHGPPLGYGDFIARGKHIGCSELLTTVQMRVKPTLHLFGHVHEGYGMWTDGQTTFINASICDKRYRPTHRPVIFDYCLGI